MPNKLLGLGPRKILSENQEMNNILACLSPMICCFGCEILIPHFIAFRLFFTSCALKTKNLICYFFPLYCASYSPFTHPISHSNFSPKRTCLKISSKFLACAKTCLIMLNPSDPSSKLNWTN